MTDLLILDCDGVLVDTEPISNAVLAESLTALGWPLTAAECVDRFMGLSEAATWALAEQALGRPVPAAARHAYAAEVERRFAAGVRPLPGIVEALDSIALPTCVASSGTHARIRLTLGATGLLPRFEGRIFSASDVARGKPAPDLFLHAARSLRARPRCCVVVEDSLPGVEAARVAGMRVLGYSGHLGATTLAAAGAEPFDDLRRLPTLLGEGAPA